MIISVFAYGCDDSEVIVPECVITNLTATIENCDSDSTYVLTIDFDIDNPGDATFDLFIRNNVLFGTYDLSDLAAIDDYKFFAKWPSL